MDDLQESAPLLMLLFLLALLAIRDGRKLLLLCVFFLGGLTNETMLILPAVYLFCHAKTANFGSVATAALRAVAVSIPLFLTVLPIRYFNRERPHLGGAFHLPDNVDGILQDVLSNPLDMPFGRYALFILLFGIFWYYAIFGYKDAPFFLRRASWIIPPFIAAHLITGKINEPRQMLPLSFIIIPISMIFLLNKKTDRNDAPT
jgi:hypothetical protein